MFRSLRLIIISFRISVQKDTYAKFNKILFDRILFCVQYKKLILIKIAVLNVLSVPNFSVFRT